MDDGPAQPQSFSALRRLGIGLNVLVSVAALAASMVMINYLAARHFTRFQWTRDARYQLSPQTQRVLDSVTNSIRAIILYDREEPLFGQVFGLLREYSFACPRVIVEHIDYKRDLARAGLVIARHQLPALDKDMVIFEAPGRAARIVRATELSEYDLNGALSGEKGIRRVAFKGEARFTEAIASLLDSRPPVAYFLQGHGEHDPAGDDRQSGYARFTKLLEQKNVTLTPLRLLGDTQMPEDCQLLIVAGPQEHKFDPGEMEKINKYLNQGGRLLALLSYLRSRHATTGFERLLANWGVTVGEDYAFDKQDSVRGFDVVCTNYSPHPVVKPLQDAGLQLYLLWARSVWPPQSAQQSPDAPKVQTLLSTSAAGWTASDLSADGVPKVNPRRDRQGVIPLAVAVEKGSIQGLSADRGSTRMVVVGESMFLGNETIVKVANTDFATLAVNWLLDRPQYLKGIAPRPVEEYTVTLSRAEMARIRWLLLGALPGGVLVLGFLVWMRRRA
jgi:ABC-type uncharacterized transport system involved in gliding motility auxiliary subunit